jgi:Tfp pilus assembly protein PilF
MLRAQWVQRHRGHVETTAQTKPRKIRRRCAAASGSVSRSRRLRLIPLLIKNARCVNSSVTMNHSSYDRAVDQIDDAALLVSRGNTHYAMKSFAAALADYDRAVAIRPDFAEAHGNRGNALREMGRHREALDACNRALALKPDYNEGYNNRGNALIELNRPADALANYDRALEAAPDNVYAWVNRGNALRYLDRAKEAIESFDRAIALAPDLAEANWNKGLLCLSVGDFARGWAGYEWRWRREGELQPRDFTQPQWRGETLVGKTILLHAEQGFGDSIQFIRYLPMVAEKGGKIILEIPDGLVPLVVNAANIDGIYRRGDKLPHFDVHCPLMSLPLAFGTTIDTIPASVPYLHSPGKRARVWRDRLADMSRPRIGLVWSGKPTHKNDHNRSIAIPRLKPLLSVAFRSVCNASIEPRPRPDQLPIRRLMTSHRRRHGGGDGELDSSPSTPGAPAGAMAKRGCAACAGLALAARPHRQPLVSDSKAVSTTADRRLGRGNCSNGKSARGLCENPSPAK